MNTLLEQIADLYAAEPVACGGMLADAAVELRCLSGTLAQVETPRLLPVANLLPAALATARSGPLAAIADAFVDHAATAHWRQNSNYTVDTIGAAFLDSYGYVELVGRGRPCASENLAVGFLLLGPGAHYPPHHHPAAEVYHVVSGVAQWGRGDEPPTAKPMGAAIYHPPNIRHETRALDQPLLALYCWRGDIGTAAQLA